MLDKLLKTSPMKREILLWTFNKRVYQVIVRLTLEELIYRRFTGMKTQNSGY